MTQSKNITNSLRFVPSILMAFSDKMKIQLHTKEATAGRRSIRVKEENLFSKKFPIG